ncbi:MAG: EAL domain-containing protein [Alcanivorax sp.]|nr:EAL domain-containing protein [Alcanivorax sp.]
MNDNNADPVLAETSAPEAQWLLDVASANARDLRALLSGRSLALLKLPADLETAFRHHARSGAAGLLRRSIFGLIALYLMVVVPVAWLVNSSGMELWLWLAVYPIGVVLAVIFLFTRLPRLDRHVEPVLSWSVFTCLTGTVYCALRLGNSFLGQVAAFETIYILIIAFSVLKLPTRLGLGGSLLAFLVALAGAEVSALAVPWLIVLLFFLVPLLICAINGYMLEYAARRDFIQMLWHEQEKRLLLKDMVAVGNDADDINTVLEFALSRMCMHMGWLLGNAPVYDTAHKEELRVCQFNGDADSDLAREVDMLWPQEYTRQLRDQVCHSGEAAWKSAALRINGKTRHVSRLAFPVRVDGSTRALLEFLSPRQEVPDANLLALMEQIGNQLGRVFERNHQRMELRTMALHDALTGLPNRSYLLKQLHAALSRARRRDSYRFGVLFLDVDRFKWVNDSLGHLAGDRLLMAFGQRLTDAVRPYDFVARLGGDEFAVIVEDVHTVHEVTRVAQRIQQSLEAPLQVMGNRVDVSASMGVVMSSRDYHEPEEMLRDADTAMYQVKRQSRGGYLRFAEYMHEKVRHRLRLVSDLRDAIENDELVLHYQPIVSLQSGRVAGFEALVRWPHEALGMLSPDAFIPLAEECGLIIPLTRWALRRAARQLGLWQRQYPQARQVASSVNLCASYFACENMPDEVLNVIADEGLWPGSLRLEITETQIIENAEDCMRNIQRLEAEGVPVYIDDFGTGYSSLNYLASFRVNALKIDRTFMTHINEDGKEAIVVRAINSLGQYLGLDVIAEGVETREQLASLQALGCQYAQGFLLARPMDVPTAERYIDKRLIETNSEARPPIWTGDRRGVFE